jgi:uncharacterized protein YjiK
VSIVGGMVRVEVDTSAAAGTNLTALSSGLTFSTKQDYGAVCEINANGEIDIINDGSGNGSLHIWEANYVPPVPNYQVYSNHPAGSTVSGRTSVATVIDYSASDGYETVSFSGNNNQWRQVKLDANGNNQSVGFSVQSTNPEIAEADLLVEILANGKSTSTVGNSQLGGANNVSSLVTGGARMIGFGTYGNSVGCLLGSFGVKWRQILAVANRYFNTGNSIAISVQGVGASGAIVTLRENQDGSGASVAQTVTAQSDSEITITVNQGALVNGPAYLFINSNGNETTDGFEVNVGLSQPGTTGFLVENYTAPAGVITGELSQIGTNTSGCTIMSNGRFAVVDNGTAQVHEYDLSDRNTRLRIITLGGLNTTEDDSEDIVNMGNGEFAVCCEDNSNYYIHIFDYPDEALGDTTVNAKQTLTVAASGGDNNSGAEGVAYDRANRIFYVAGEGEQANTNQEFFRVVRPLSEHTDISYDDVDITLDVSEPFDAQILTGDLSSAVFHEATGDVVIASHTSSNLKQLDPNGDGTVKSTYQLEGGHQFEGFTFRDGDDGIALSEANKYVDLVYPAVATPVVLNDAEGIAAGTSSVTDITAASQLENIEGISLGVSSSTPIQPKIELANVEGVSLGTVSSTPITAKILLENVEGISSGVSSSTELESSSSLNNVEGVSIGVSSAGAIAPKTVLSNVDGISSGIASANEIGVGQSLENAEGISAGVSSALPATPKTILTSVTGISQGVASAEDIALGNSLSGAEGVAAGTFEAEPITTNVALNSVEGISIGVSSSVDISVGQSLENVEGISAGTNSVETIRPHSVLSEVEGISAGISESEELGNRLTLSSVESISLGVSSANNITPVTQLFDVEGIAESTSELGELNYLPADIILTSCSRSRRLGSISKTVHLT